MKIRKYSIIFLMALGFLNACSVDKYIPEDEYLYRGADISLIPDTTSIKDLGKVKTELQNVLVPKPNSKFLGGYPGLYFHYKAQREKPGIINKFLDKKIGEEPVYLSDVEIGNTQDLILNRLENRGFFYSRVSANVNTNDKKKIATAAYDVGVTTPYRMESYQLVEDSLLIYQDMKPIVNESKFFEEMRFDLANMKNERQRIDVALKEKGYYNFNSGFLLFQADTNQYDNKRFDLFLKVKKDVPEKALIPYKISKVNIYPNSSIQRDSLEKDSIRFNNKTFVQDHDSIFFLPKRLDPFVLIEEGDYYSPDISKATSRRLGSIGAYKFINIDYEEVDTLATDSLGVLEANIYLSPLNKRAIRAELQAVTKSNNFAGPSLALSLTNRNLFKGGEIINIQGRFGYEVQVASGNNTGLNSIQLGVGSDLIFPRLLFPWHFNEDFFKYDIPKTKISLNVDYLRRSQLFALGSASSTFGYIWNANKYVTHSFDPVSVTYVDLINTTPEFEEILDENPYLRSSFEQQFIAGSMYSFTYNGMVDQNKTHQFFVNSTLDIAGNFLDLVSGNAEEDPQTVFNLEYAQYAKADVDFRYHLNLDSGTKIATRLFAGYGMPYGNSEIIPFTKQYFSGGPYSVRAFRIRQLGPGVYNPDNQEQDEDPDAINTDYFDRAGNIRLEANIEYRFPLFPPYVNGAVFADAGNVWTSTEETSLPGGKFSSNFMNELGIGTGVGVRVDIQGFVIRFDLAAPMHDPSLPEGDRWTYDFGSPIFNFAIGYPF
ncbi:BamA/TamA family outer membrane protein [Zunongwangia sp. SCSIO 43204]|uniref:translocation and assembly module lipoprotein TamL n=1 Tax=Zunongwangia sp. SCSIO 43204 TaxID=2779359 RepID=UPI001CA8256A|nr:BamA/TamA family outer membrane protein [Zunongwangia sp. SCSIO 43204]UAB83574.1 BamA/TamA family outer membrane protein [Zunongwangia sp. SCSIO 43204]